MTTIITREPGFRHNNYPAPTLAEVTPRLPTDREVGADHHWLLGSDNPTNACMVTGDRLHPNMRGYIDDGGTGWTVAPTVTIANGAEAYALVTPSSVWTTVITNGGTGYSTVPTLSVSGGTYAAGGRAPRIRGIAVGGGALTSVALLDAGEGILVAPTVNITGGGGSGAVVTLAITQSVKTIAVTNGGSGYTGAPSVAINGGTSGSLLAARAVAEISGGVVIAVHILDGGYGYISTPSIVFASGGGTGAAATASIGPNCVRSIIVTNPGAQSGNVSASLTGGDGAGATGGALVATPTYVRTANTLTIPAGGTTDNVAQNGLNIPVMDDGEFTQFVVAKKTTAATSQLVMGTASNAGATTGGFELKWLTPNYQVLNFNVNNPASNLTTPGASGDYVMFVYAQAPQSGESVQPSSAKVQSTALYARCGLSTALTVATGEQKVVDRPKMLGVGNCYQVGVTFRAALDIAEVIVYRRKLTTAEIDAVRTRSAVRLAARGITLVNS